MQRPILTLEDDEQWIEESGLNESSQEASDLIQPLDKALQDPGRYELDDPEVQAETVIEEALGGGNPDREERAQEETSETGDTREEWSTDSVTQEDELLDPNPLHQVEGEREFH